MSLRRHGPAMSISTSSMAPRNVRQRRQWPCWTGSPPLKANFRLPWFHAAMKVLLVEDDMDIGNGVRVALTDQGMTVVWVRRLADALASLETAAHDIVLLDLGLPDGDGIALLQRLRRERKTLPVLILTARDSLADKLL